MTNMEDVKKRSVPEVSVEDDIRKRIPSKWRKSIDEALGKDFECEVDDSTGGNFLMRITVPAKWDCRVGDEKNMSMRDYRSGLIRRSSDIADVEKWCALIKANILKTYPNFKSV